MKNFVTLFHSKLMRFIIVSILILGVMLFFFSQNHIPKEAEEIVLTYWDIMQKEDYDGCMELLYFKPENFAIKFVTRDAFPNQKLLSYSIIKYKKINNRLYEVTAAISTMIAKETHNITNYVAKIEDKWKYITNSREVPNDIYKFENSDEQLILFS